MKTFNKIVGILIGMLMMIGAVAAWHFWRIDGFLASIAALGGFWLIAYALGEK